jgi:hypothetical protein
MNKEIKVLIFPCGSENAIEIFHALKDVVNIKLFGASSKDDHGSYLFKNYIGNVPYITDINFPIFFKNVLEKNEIDFVFPTHDDVALFLSEKNESWPSKIAGPGHQQALICRSKKRTYDLFENYDFCPSRYNGLERAKFPMFAKPDKGQGGIGVLRIDNEAVLEKTLFEKPDYIITEFLPGEELTVDCFTNRHGKLLFVGARSRDRIWGGISTRSTKKKPNGEIEKIADIISKELKMNGLWYFQVKKSEEGKYKLLEVSIRTAGTMNLFRMTGVNFPLLTLYNALNLDVEIIPFSFEVQVDRSLKNRYRHNISFKTVYIDFDDTITTKDKVNFETLALLYNLKHQGKSIVLITRHQGDIFVTLDKLAIHKGLFKEIIHISENDEKYRYIDLASNPIFIDNSFRERSLVFKHKGIPVFDVDATELLLDWKR